MSRRIATSSWVPLIQYANERGVSLSTLRRHIKAKKIQYKIENGRYLIFDEAGDSRESNAPHLNSSTGQRQSYQNSSPQSSGNSSNPDNPGVPGLPGLKEETVHLRADLRKAREEIVELKTLIALYEEKITGHSSQQRR